MRLLICIDALPTAADALAEARLIARALPVEATLLAGAASEAEVASLLAQAREELGVLQGLDEVRAVGASIEDTAAALCRERHFDMVVAAPAGRRGFVRLLQGSRALKMVRQTIASVWIARRPVDSVRRILVGVSSAPHSEIDVRFAGYLARAFGAQLSVLHVVSQVPLIFTGLAHLRYNLEQFIEMDTPGARQLKRAREVLAEMHVQGQIEIREGLVSDELAAEAQSNYDLLVVGAHVGEGMAGLLLDNITEHALREIAISTLVVRSEPDWREFVAAGGVSAP